jgi:hypothetical protein
MELWKKTAKSRLSYIHLEDQILVNDIILEWPRYADEDGYVLVSK